jgi:hypothetical protein
VNKVETGGRKMPGHGFVGKKYVERKIRFLYNQEWIAITREDMKNENFSPFFIRDFEGT